MAQAALFRSAVNSPCPSYEIAPFSDTISLRLYDFPNKSVEIMDFICAVVRGNLSLLIDKFYLLPQTNPILNYNPSPVILTESAQKSAPSFAAPFTTLENMKYERKKK